MDQLTFDTGLGVYTVTVAPDSVWVHRGLGSHYFRLQLEVGVPEIGPEAGQLLMLDTRARRGARGLGALVVLLETLAR